MKALILSVTAGYGHHSTGMAMMEVFKAHGIECEMLDTLEYISRFLGESVQNGYLLLTKNLGEAYGKVFDSLAKKEEPSKSYSPETIISKYLSKKLDSFMLDYNPDFVVGTHSYATVLMTLLKERGVLNCPTFGVVTDFTLHPFWESTRLDYYILPDSLLNSAAERKGIPEDKILPFGIPIKQKFLTKLDKEEAKKRLGLTDKPLLLVMMGSMGFGDITEVIKTCDSLKYDYQIAVICGNNEKAKDAIDSMKWEKDIMCLGFTENVDIYMDAADALITKPGGLTTSEAMAKGLPLILMNPIPGQEERNMEFLVNSGAAIMVTKGFSVEQALHQLFGNTWRKELMIRAIRMLGKPDAANKLYEFIEENVYKKPSKGVVDIWKKESLL